MPVLQSINNFFKQYTTLPDRVLLILTTLGLMIAGGLILLNQLVLHFTTAVIFATDAPKYTWYEAALIILFCLYCLFYGMYIQLTAPRSSTFIWGLGWLFWCSAANLLLTNAIQCTPFPPIDATLVKLDYWMRINTTALMSWTHLHPQLHHIFLNSYNLMIVQLFGVPIALAILNARRSLGVFFIAQSSTLLLGSLIYFFFPTIAPAGMLHSPYFITAQHDTSLRFYEVHHHLKVTASDGGLIAFPSFHVVWAILLTYACRGRKIIFYSMAVFNIILIASTVLLGWHYFMDVIGGVILAVTAILFSEKMYQPQLKIFGINACSRVPLSNLE